MDGISAAASVTTLITLALQSSTFIYQFLHTIRDGPKRVVDLARRVDGLHQSLRQIAGLIQLAESSDEDDSHNGRCPSKYLRSALFLCADDLQGIQTKISDLKVCKDNKMRKVWSGIKHVLGSEYLEHADRIISRNLHELNLQLNIVGQGSHLANDKLTRNIKDIVELSSAVVTVSLLEQKAQRTLLEAFEEESQKRHELLDTATERIEGLTSASDAQLSEITKMVRDIQMQLRPKVYADVDKMTSTTFPASFEQSPFEQDLQPSMKPDPLSMETVDRLLEARFEPEAERALLDSAIDRLCLLASLKPRKVATQEAEHIIDDLETILTMIQRQGQLLEPSESRGIKRKVDALTGVKSHELISSPDRALKRLRRILTTSQIINLQQNSLCRQPSDKMKGRISHNSTRRFELEDNTVVVSYTVRAPPHSGQTRIERVFEDIEDEASSEQIIEMFEGNISVIVPKAPHATKLTAYFEQIVTSCGSSMLHPRILFHCIRPLESAIFHVAARGTLVELLALLQTHEASLNDCDEFGRSILNYALSKSNVPICRFLTKHNYVDVNAVEQVVSDYPHRTYRPLFGLYEKLSNLDSEESSCSIDCQRLLLEAGADPTIHTEGSSPFLEIASSGTLAALRLMLDTDPYIDLEQRDAQGRTALMLLVLHASRVGTQADQEEIYVMAMTLLDHGADINASDMDDKGCFEIICDAVPLFHHKQMQKLLTLLIDRGYDIYRTDCKKLSICETALESHLGYLWFEALQASKLDYRLSVVLVEDHARYHKRLEADTHYHSEMSHDGHGNPEVLETRENVQEIAVTNVPFTKCLDHVCGWLGWRYINVISTTTNPDGGGDIIHTWAIRMWFENGRNRRCCSYLLENDMVVDTSFQGKDFNYSRAADYSLQELIIQPDLNDEAKTRSQECKDQEHTHTIDEDACEASSNHNGSLSYTVDPEDSAASLVNQQSRSDSLSALTSACCRVDHETETSEDNITNLEEDALGDEILQNRPSPLEPRPMYNADPQLSFNPWN